MTSIEYIQQKLGGLSKQFPHLTFKYAFDTIIQTHVVEISPEAAYYHNKQLDNAWIPVSLEFMQLFEDETISFISSDSILAPSNPELVFNSQSLIHEGVY